VNLYRRFDFLTNSFGYLRRLITRFFISEVESSSLVVPIVIMLLSCVIESDLDFLIVLSKIMFSSSISSSRYARASSSPCLRIDAPFCPGCSPKSANWSPSRIDVFPDPMSPARSSEPLGNLISRFS